MLRVTTIAAALITLALALAGCKTSALEDPNLAAPALFERIRSLGIQIFENQNGRIMEADGGASVPDMLIRDGKRQSVFRSYVVPYMDRPNLTVLPPALVTQLTFEDKRTTGVQI